MEDKKVLPASAGMILPPVSSTHRRSCAPRIRGDDPPPPVRHDAQFIHGAPRIRGDDPH